MKLFTQHVVRGDYWVPINCSLTVDGGVASLISWLDHSYQKTEVGGKLRMLREKEFCSNKSPGPEENQMALSS